jgi:hypothetical protein
VEFAAKLSGEVLEKNLDLTYLEFSIVILKKIKKIRFDVFRIGDRFLKVSNIQATKPTNAYSPKIDVQI